MLKMKNLFVLNSISFEQIKEKVKFLLKDELF